MKSPLFLIFFAVAALTACSTPPPAAEKPDDSRALIAAALKRAEEMPRYTASADAKAPAAVMKSGAMFISYAGDAKDLLRQVCASRGLTFRVRGVHPHLPLFVIVDVKGVAFEEFLSDIASQFGQRASLALTDSAIEVRYRDQ